jgi:hypothetical protein
MIPLSSDFTMMQWKSLFQGIGQDLNHSIFKYSTEDAGWWERKILIEALTFF